MARILLQRARSGFRTVRGEVVRRVQLALNEAGASAGDVDGIFGGDTEAALKSYQAAHGQPATGKLTDVGWTALTHAPIPPVFDRCLQITADFEGHGFRKIAGNFDGAGLTWGIIGFTLQHGEIQEIVRKVQQQRPELLARAFGPLLPTLASMLDAAWPQQLAWANGLSLGSQRYRIEAGWEAAFARLGDFPEVQAIQLERVRRYWGIAERDAQRFDLTTELGIALCFDVAVQNGGIDDDREGRRVRRWIAENPGASERARRVAIADAVAENSRPTYVEDVRHRKRAVATGEGEVHGAKYALADWGIGEDPRA